MGEVVRRRRDLSAVWAALGLVASYAGMFGGERLFRALDAVIWSSAEDDPTKHALHGLLRTFEGVVGPTYVFALVLATLLVPVGLSLRVFARARVRAGDRDPLERARGWVKRHAGRALALVALPGVFWTALLVRAFHRFGASDVSVALELVRYALLALVPLVGLTLLGRAALRAYVAPLVDARGGEPPPALERDEIVFSALAVTGETRAAVALSAGSALAAVLIVVSAPLVGIGLAIFPVLLAAVYYRASRIAVGIDGVLIRGTSRTRFFSYRDFDEVRVRFGDVVLLQRGHVVIRLQLHGDDAARRDAIVARIREALERVSARRGHATEELVVSTSAADLTRAVAGAVDFRRPPVSRDALWEIVEGPTVDAGARASAASALARAFDETDRDRLRVVAAQCAEPRLRVALEALEEDLDLATKSAERARRAVI